MHVNNHQADQRAIDAMHSQLSGHINDRLLSFQDEAYAMGRARGRLEGLPWIAVTDQLPTVQDGQEQEFIVCVHRAHDGKRYVFSARWLNNFPLHSEGHPDADDDGCMLATGWHDVKEHSDYDGWYSPLITTEGDAVTHWMPLPTAPGSAV
ncbi:DUF551 domain-containing protein [Pseudomonas nitroreducens]|uniref:DUF551 domain-containing protein n=1 Tax=Pseudomonas nitroreducens TaxID=46680 RepID=A0A5R8ZRC3_PSENT|nr:DUF551 domain-containing protein [Pseudomonas nitroreducens]TLP68199.1 DUF551 domain-containing protein [Pseudomonas nitroreducens]